MKKLFLIILSCFLCCYAMAQDVELTTQDGEEQEDLNAFGFPDKSLVKVIENKDIEEVTRDQTLPDCDNDALLEKAREAVAKYIDFDGSTILTKRKALLTLKNVDNFVVLPQEEVSATQHSIVAARLVELKINNHIAKADIEICQSDNAFLGAKLYLIIYPFEQNKTKVEILNFANDIVPTFIFEQ